MYLENQQTYNTFVFQAEKDTPLKSFLLDDMHFSIRQYISLKKNPTSIHINGKRRRKDEHVIKKDSLVEVFLEAENSDYLHQYKNDLDVVYEDADILIINKPAFMVVHPSKAHLQDTLLNYVQGYFEEKDIRSKVRFVSRLDRDTSGLITIAKNPFSHHALSQGFVSSSIQKCYTAVAYGSPPQKQGSIQKNIALSCEGIRREISPQGQPAITHYRTLEEGKNYCLLELLLETGRTHQIRVHLQSIGCPILGDALYFQESPYIQRQALHCSKLQLQSPRSGKVISLESPLPPDMMSLLQHLREG